MEQEPQEEVVKRTNYKVFWHPNVKEDFEKIPLALTERIVSSVEYKLSSAPLLMGEPLKGTATQLWKVGYSKYRIIYTLNPKCREVWVLSVMKREIVYRDAHVQALIQMAMAIQDRIEKC